MVQVPIFILSADSIRSFAFAMIIGVLVGAFSSIFLASPIAYLVLGRKIKKEQAAGAAIVS